MEKETKSVEATEKAVALIKPRSGCYRVEGVPGLYLRALARCNSYFVQRRVRGKLIKQTLGPMPVKLARETAMKVYGELSPKPAPGHVMTLEKAFAGFMKDHEKKHAATTKKTYRGIFRRHLEQDWGKLALTDIRKNRAGVRQLYRDISEHTLSGANLTIKLLSGIWRWARREEPEIGESPTAAVTLDKLEPRDWAMDDAALIKWWRKIQEEETPLARMFFLVSLLTGARRDSVESLENEDIDLEAGTMFFRVAKGGKQYTIIMSEVLKRALRNYYASGIVKPGERWLFPSPMKRGRHAGRFLGRVHHTRHTFSTTGTRLGIADIYVEILLGHSLGALSGLSAVAGGYKSAGVFGENLEAATNTISHHYAKLLGLPVE